MDTKGFKAVAIFAQDRFNAGRDLSFDLNDVKDRLVLVEERQEREIAKRGQYGLGSSNSYRIMELLTRRRDALKIEEGRLQRTVDAIFAEFMPQPLYRDDPQAFDRETARLMEGVEVIIPH